MPYASIDELPEGVRNNLPEHAQHIYLGAYNNAWVQYADPGRRRGNASQEDVARKVAWAAVKREYEKDETTGRWEKRFESAKH
jgi:cation transport regulator